MVPVASVPLVLKVNTGEMQLDERQESPAAHTLPQLPQFLSSVVSSTQEPLHLVVVPVQMQALDTQAPPGPQLMPQPPQFAASLVVSTQGPPHLSMPAPVHTQVLAEHASPAAHVF